jgi:hypothetical protein
MSDYDSWKLAAVPHEANPDEVRFLDLQKASSRADILATNAIIELSIALRKATAGQPAAVREFAAVALAEVCREVGIGLTETE